MGDYINAYNAARETIDLFSAAANEKHKSHKNVSFKSNDLFMSSISKINDNLIDNI